MVSELTSTEEETSLKTWAVLTDIEGSKLGISDAVIAELSARNIDLVEREEVDRAGRELLLKNRSVTRSRKAAG
ncbi:MAG: hypothetical protein U0892_19565 [Pirellulales bacterium]